MQILILVSHYETLNLIMLPLMLCHEGLRPPTDNLPFPLVHLVQECWNANPTLRPSFPEILSRVQRLETMNNLINVK